MLGRLATVVYSAALAGCAMATTPSDAGTDVGAATGGTCRDEMAALDEARRACSTLGCTTSLPCGPSFGHCGECFFEFSCEMGVVVIRANGVACDTGIARLDGGPDGS